MQPPAGSCQLLLEAATGAYGTKGECHLRCFNQWLVAMSVAHSTCAWPWASNQVRHVTVYQLPTVASTCHLPVTIPL